MKLVVTPSYSAAFNLALEEYLMTHFEDEFFMLWMSENAILIGKHQNTYTEINIPYVKEHQIEVVRRMSGGGTVFCDPGNINFTFIENTLGNFADFKKFTAPIISYINHLGAPAQFSGRNDLVIDDKKFSGNAQYRIKSRTLHHGTLLFDSKLGALANALTPREEKFKGKAIDSVKARVTNIKAYLPDQSLTVSAFKSGIYKHIMSSFEDSSYYSLTHDDLEAVQKLVDEKYATWQWNYGDSPKYDYTNVKKFPSGLVELGITVQKGVIKQLAIHGDFFASKETNELCDALIGTKHEKSDILTVLTSIHLGDYLQGIDAEAFADFMTEV